MALVDKNDFFEENQTDLRWYLLQFRVFEEKIEKAFILLHKNGIEPVLIKGWAAARNYPEPSLRVYSDIDLAVAPEEFEKAKNVIKNSPANIDLHRGLRHLDTVKWEDLFENTEIVEIGKTKVRILRPEDHLRVLSVHWLNDGGAYKERLWDIYYAVKNRPADFDWKRCLDVVNPKRRRWIVCAIGLAERYLELDLNDTPVAVDGLNLPGWLIKTVEYEWKSGIKLKPLDQCLGNRKEFWAQVKKRFPPNPIQAAIEMEGDFDSRNRIFYQIGSVFFRIKPSIKRLGRVVWRRKDGK